jgi:hypothetical protein
MKRQRRISGATTMSDPARGRARTFVIRKRRSQEDVVFLLVTRTDMRQDYGERNA